MIKPDGPSCQSCGMPLSRDEKGGGTNADGSRSAEYCSHCFQAGKFTQPALTVDQMVANVQTRLRSMSMPPAVVETMAGMIPSLRRWKV
jgi:hypothetical protein